MAKRARDVKLSRLKRKHLHAVSRLQDEINRMKRILELQSLKIAAMERPPSALPPDQSHHGQDDLFSD